MSNNYKMLECSIKVVQNKIEKYLIEKEIERMVQNARVSVEMEGLTPSKESEEISKKYLKGKISDREAKKADIKT